MGRTLHPIVPLAVLAATCCASPQRPVAPEIRPSIGRLAISTPDGDGHCTGFVVAPQIVATAGHCLRDPMASYTYDGLSATLLSVTDPGSPADLGLLRVPNLRARPLAVAKSDPSFGSEVSTVGYPANVLLTYRGTWSGRDEDGDGVVGMVSYMGASGSAVVDSKGRVVCVLRAIRRDYTGVTYCVNVDRLAGFLDANRVRYRRS